MRKQNKSQKKKSKNNKVQQQTQQVKKRLIQKKPNINFKYGIGHVLFFQRYSNIFLVLKTENKKHVVTLTAGSCKLGKTKKQKISPFNVNLIVKELKQYCKIYDIGRIRFFLRSTINKHYYNILKYLSLYNIKIMEIGYILHTPHNGMRKRKPRRI